MDFALYRGSLIGELGDFIEETAFLKQEFCFCGNYTKGYLHLAIYITLLLCESKTVI